MCSPHEAAAAVRGRCAVHNPARVAELLQVAERLMIAADCRQSLCRSAALRGLETLLTLHTLDAACRAEASMPD